MWEGVEGSIHGTSFHGLSINMKFKLTKCNKVSHNQINSGNTMKIPLLQYPQQQKLHINLLQLRNLAAYSRDPYNGVPVELLLVAEVRPWCINQFTMYAPQIL
jgi:hypothetical protein